MEEKIRDKIEEDFELIQNAFDRLSDGRVILDEYNKVHLDNGCTGLSIKNGIKHFLVTYNYHKEEYEILDNNTCGNKKGFHRQPTYGEFAKITDHWTLAKYVVNSHSGKYAKTKKNARTRRMESIFDEIAKKK